MKKMHLWIPCNFETRQPIIIQRLLYIPKNYKQHQKFSPLDLKEIFPANEKTFVEFCSGNGQWIIEKAQENPTINWIGVEKRFDRARKIWSKMQKLKLNNLFVVLSDAETFSKYYLQEGQISSIFINFPDPWPKRRHAKHRLIKEPFLLDLQKILLKGSEITLVTDNESYRNQILETFQKNLSFKPIFPPPFYQMTLKEYGTSFFESLWKEKGRNIFYIKYTHKND